MKKDLKEQKGITLIALIISIIILLILAMVSIRLLINGGIITRAENATNQYEIAQEKEKIALGYSEYQMSKYTGGATSLSVDGATVTPDGTGWKVEFAETGNAYKLYPDGTIEISDGNTIVAWDGTTKTEVAEIDNKYYIANASELAWFANEVNTGSNLFEGKEVILTADIDLGNQEWTPIGAITSTGGYNLFGGTTGATFNGNGHVIKNIKVTNCSLPAAGFFVATINATIKNLGIESGSIEGLAVSSIDEGVSTKCTQIGGILGVAMGNVTIESCFNRGVNLSYDTNGHAFGAAGIVSGNMGILTITNCYNTATSDRKGEASFSGILSQNLSGATVTITNYYNIGDVQGNGTVKTGIYGGNEGTVNNIQNCYAVSFIEGTAETVEGITIKENLEAMRDISLGDAFKTNATDKNSGCPILSWE